MATKRAGLTLPNVYFESEVTKFKQTAYYDGLMDGVERCAQMFIKSIHEKMGYSAEQIVDIVGFHTHFVQSVIDKCKQEA